MVMSVDRWMDPTGFHLLSWSIFWWRRQHVAFSKIRLIRIRAFIFIDDRLLDPPLYIRGLRSFSLSVWPITTNDAKSDRVSAESIDISVLMFKIWRIRS